MPSSGASLTSIFLFIFHSTDDRYSSGRRVGRNSFIHSFIHRGILPHNLHFLSRHFTRFSLVASSRVCLLMCPLHSFFFYVFIYSIAARGFHVIYLNTENVTRREMRNDPHQNTKHDAIRGAVRFFHLVRGFRGCLKMLHPSLPYLTLGVTGGKKY